MSDGIDWEAARSAHTAMLARLEEAEFQRAKRLQQARAEQEEKEQKERAALGLPSTPVDEVHVDPYPQGAFLCSTGRVGEPGNPRIDTLGALYIAVLSEQNAKDVEQDFAELSTVEQDHARYEGRRHIELAGDFRTLPVVQRAEAICQSRHNRTLDYKGIVLLRNDFCLASGKNNGQAHKVALTEVLSVLEQLPVPEQSGQRIEKATAESLPASHREHGLPDGEPLLPAYIKAEYSLSSGYMSKHKDELQDPPIKVGKAFAYSYRDVAALSRKKKDPTVKRDEVERRKSAVRKVRLKGEE